MIHILDWFKKKRSPRFKKVFIIINPTAGRARFLNYSKAIHNFFSKIDIEYDYVITKRSGEATTLAKWAVKEKFDLIIAAGGDGTTNEVVNGIGDSQVTLGIIPIGTINILSKELNIPLTFNRALKLILSGKIESMDMGRVNDRYFVLMAGCGIDSYAIYRVNIKLKKFLGPLAYIISGIYSLWKYKPHKITINIDDHRIDDFGYFVVAENVSTYGGKFKIAPYADVNDGLLDICIFKKTGVFDVFRYFIGIALKKHIDYPDVRYYQCKKIELTSEQNVLLHTDGELIGSTPAIITVLPKKLKVLVPKDD